jgi:hypothetical protein
LVFRDDDRTESISDDGESSYFGVGFLVFRDDDLSGRSLPRVRLPLQGVSPSLELGILGFQEKDDPRELLFFLPRFGLSPTSELALSVSLSLPPPSSFVRI